MRETAFEKYRERSRRAGDRTSASPGRVTKYILLKTVIPGSAGINQTEASGKEN
jgi:hypothetical protein